MSTAHGKSAKYTDDNLKRRPKNKAPEIYLWIYLQLIIFLKNFFQFFFPFLIFFFSRYNYVTSKQSIPVMSAQSPFNMQVPPPPPPSLPRIGARPPLWPRLLWLQEHRDVAHSPHKNRLTNSTFPSETKPLNRTQKRCGYLWLELLWRGAGRPQTTCRSLAGHRVSLLRQYI